MSRRNARHTSPCRCKTAAGRSGLQRTTTRRLGPPLPGLAESIHRRAASCRRAGTWRSPFPRRPEGMADRDARGKVLNAIAHRPLAASAARLTCLLDEDPLIARGRRRLRAGTSGTKRAQLPLRHPRARDGPRRQRHDALWAPPLRFHLPDLLRLSLRPDPPLGADGTAGDLRLHPRQYRRGRGRPRPTSRSNSPLPSAPFRTSLVIRPADANEVAEAWRCVALRVHDYTGKQAGPVALVLTRQPLPTIDRSSRMRPPPGLRPGAYVLADLEGPSAGHPDCYRLRVQRRVAAPGSSQGRGDRLARRSSLLGDFRAPACRVDRESVLPPRATPASPLRWPPSFAWERYVGPEGRIIGRRGLRRVRPAAQARQGVWLHRRANRLRRPRSEGALTPAL